MIPPKLRLITDDITLTELVVYPSQNNTVKIAIHGEPLGQWGSEYSMVATLREDQAELLVKAIREIQIL